ncbi:MAG: methyl-accepting chemotaxis protein [Planctomycetes bacterium]|nr:methyl-accepting chemotaxis protein [Planctomycetota bacterium]
MKKMKLSAKLLLAFLAVGVIPACIIGFLALSKSSSALEEQSYNTLVGMRDVKKAQIEGFFAERKGDMGVLMETVNTLRGEAFSKLTAVGAIKKNQVEGYFGERLELMKDVQKNLRFTGGVTDFSDAFALGSNSEEYKKVYEKRNDGLKTFMDIFGFYDVFLIDSKGDVVYTACLESDFGQNLVTGSLSDSGLARVFKESQSDTALVDFAWYDPSNEPASFIGTPLRDSNGKFAGVAAFQVSLKQINAIMQERTGMGKTGECYLVGSDKLMRSDSFLDPKGHSVKASFAGTVATNGCDTEASRLALSGKSGADVILDYNGNPVLSAYAPLEIAGLKWAILAEIDVAEAFSPVDEQGNEYYSKYIEQYGYYDLFLINPDGYCFYTSCREADYQTNLVNGKYASSGLGVLTREVLSSRRFGLADFAPYAPSNDEPAAFIAQPVIHGGEVELVVALQLSLDSINGIMQQRAGMGETGETYLVGQDKLMRSDSFLDPTGHSVKASFAGTVAKNGVDTEAAKEALSGKTDSKIIIDYNGNPVLSAFTPVDVGDTTWALIAEIDKSEAFAAKNAITWIITVVLIVAVLATLTIAILITRSITLPINKIIAGLTEGSEQVSSAAGQVSSASQSLAEGATEQAAGLEETSSSLEEMASMTKQNADNAQQANTLASDARKAADTGNESMGRMNTAIQDIQKSSDETAKIIKVIDEIAFQTNLLALNAAVEAARAGEAGKGFAVVAEEVRNLAMRSAEAAKDTSGMIEESVKNANNGVEIATEVSKVLEDIVEGIGKTTDLVGEIAAASQEQSQGIDQVNTAVNQMDKVTQANAANAEESASASEELSAQAEQMNSIVSELSALVGGDSNTVNTTSTGKTLKTSDHAFHQIAGGPAKTQTSQDTAEKSIPLGNAGDFEGFNS